MKNCRFCAEEIQDEAKKCKHCGEFLAPEETNNADPQKTADLDSSNGSWPLDQSAKLLLLFALLSFFLTALLFSGGILGPSYWMKWSSWAFKLSCVLALTGIAVPERTRLPRIVSGPLAVIVVLLLGHAWKVLF